MVWFDLNAIYIYQSTTVHKYSLIACMAAQSYVVYFTHTALYQGQVWTWMRIFGSDESDKTVIHYIHPS